MDYALLCPGLKARPARGNLSGLLAKTARHQEVGTGAHGRLPEDGSCNLVVLSQDTSFFYRDKSIGLQNCTRGGVRK